MSKYEDYSEVSKVYDKERTAMGADTIAGLLHVYGGKPLKDLHVLDAGCGTGNYAKALIEFGVGKITLLDASKDMLDVAKEKLKTEIEKGIVDQVIEAKMPPLPFEDGKFDVVLFSLVLHHIDDTGNGTDFPILENVFNEAKRTLSSRGVMLILTCLPTAKDYAWYGKLHEGLFERHVKLFPTIRQYFSIFTRCGFEMRTKLNILGADIINEYYDPEGPLRESWRKGDSIFGYASEDEIRDIEKFVRNMKEDGTLEEFMRRHDKALDVLHHIDDTSNGVDFPILEDVFREAKRTLSSRGIMVLLTCLPTVIHSVWYAKLQEGLHNRHAKLYPTIKQYIGIFARCGFQMRTKLNILGAEILKDYYDAEGPLKESWRKGDSIFRFASEDEIRNIEVSVRRMKENGTLEEYMRKHDKAMEVGLITLILCVAQ